jgi:hypothetical protein
MFGILQMEPSRLICTDSLGYRVTDTLAFSLTFAVNLRLTRSVFSHKAQLILRMAMILRDSCSATAALNAPVFAGLRAGRMGESPVLLTGAWSLERVWPIFGTQSGSSTTSTCVLFGRRQMAGAHPAEIDRWEVSVLFKA